MAPSPRRSTLRLALTAALLLPAAARAVVLPVPVEPQDNHSSTCGSCGSASLGMALAYLGGQHSADWIEAWLYDRLPCGPGDAALADAANQYCRAYLGGNCAQAVDWTSGNAQANALAQLEAGRPFVAHTLWPFSSGSYGHYVTLVGIEGGQAHVNEPARAERQVMAWSTFAGRWAEKGYQGVVFTLGGQSTDTVMDDLLYQSVAVLGSTTSDVDGDGRADVCARYAAGVRCHLATGHGFSSGLPGPELSDAAGWASPVHFPSLRMADVNGDGLADVCARSAARFECWLSVGNGFGAHFPGPELSNASGWDGNEYASTIRLADVNGDGRDDLCARAAAGFMCWLSDGQAFTTRIELGAMRDADGWNHPEYYGTIRMGDIDGDGRMDVCARAAAGLLCWRSLGDRFSAVIGGPEWSDARGWAEHPYWSTIRMADMNADGRVDVCARYGAGFKCWLSDGGGFPTPFDSAYYADEPYGWDRLDQYSTLRLGDFTGDGKADICGRASTGVFCIPSTGTGFGTSFQATQWSNDTGWGDPDHYRTIRLADVNGDGRDDLCGRYAAGFKCWLSDGVGFPSLIELGDLADAGGWSDPAYYSTIRAVTPRPFVQDETPPAVVLTAPQEGEILGQSPVLVRWTATGAIQQTDLRVDGGSWTAAPGGGQAELELTGGQHLVEVRVTDDAARSASDSVQFEVRAGGCEPSQLQSKAVWALGTSVRERGAAAFAAELTQAGVTDVYVMVKGSSGAYRFDTLDELQAAAPELRVHAWVACFYDTEQGGWIAPGDAAYRAYLLDTVLTPLLAEHAPDGLILDYVRYPGTANGEVASVTSFVQQVRDRVDALRPGTPLGAAVMPEGAAATAQAYGQDYAQLAEPLDAILPMTYTTNYEEDAAWVEAMTQAVQVAAAGRAEVWPALQSLDDDGAPMAGTRLAGEIEAALAGGATGVSLFRYPLVEDQVAALAGFPVERCELPTEPPRITILAPVAGAMLRNPVQLEWQVEAAQALTSLEVSLDQADWAPQGLGSTSLELPELAAGPHTVLVRAEDSAGLSGLAQISFSVLEQDGGPDGGSDGGTDPDPDPDPEPGELEGGCQCQSTRSPPALPLLALGLLLVLRRLTRPAA